MASETMTPTHLGESLAGVPGRFGVEAGLGRVRGGESKYAVEERHGHLALAECVHECRAVEHEVGRVLVVEEHCTT